MTFADERHAGTLLASHGPGSRAASLSTRQGLNSDGDGDAPAHDSGPACCTTVELGSMSFMRMQGPAQEACLQAMQAIREGRRLPLQLLVIRRGSLTANDQSGSSVTLGPDDMALIEGGGTTELLSLQWVDAWIIGLSEPLIARWLQGLPTVTAQRLQGDQGWARVLSAYLRNWELDPLRGLISPFEKEIIGEHVMSLLSMALAQSCAACDAPRVCARDRGLYTRMQQWIRDNYSNPDIGVATLADRFGVSTRYVHKVFLNAGQGQTFLDAVRLARLEAAAQWLQSAAKTQIPMSDIADRCGFSDPGYFGQVFRRKYGSSPSAYARKFAPAPETTRPCATPD
ncbi:helix-turn-helix transcriptional regulator [Variovorax boronicumulans]|uniref:helix-turn-helix transcriptional regulator n=1 Tax=Variovorax boronicumulans TaxID=436515 RepID=UPI001C58B3F3